MSRPIDASVQSILGYLNFSDGAPSGKFQAAVNDYFRNADPGDTRPVWIQLSESLRSRLAEWAAGGSPFGDVSRAEQAVQLVFDQALPEYRRFHRDLLFHLTDIDLFQPFFLARVAEASLTAISQGARPRSDEPSPEDAANPLARDVVERLNDFVGHRPVALLENERLLQPYPHERVRPIPIYLRGVGVSVGPRAHLIEAGLQLLRDTDPDVLADIWLDVEQIEELSLDPRAYDHGHPVNHRPGYQFGEWDPHQIDVKGRYRRFVLRPIILDVIDAWLTEGSTTDPDEAMFEASAVLAGTILLASGVSGGGPGDVDSEITPSALVQRISKCRDRFYAELVEKRPGVHGDRLRSEAKVDRQPFGRLRQFLNLQLGRHRAAQLQHDHLAQVFAQMGYPDHAEREAQVIPAASVRIRCEVENLHIGCRRSIETNLPRAAEQLSRGIRRIRDGIACGALVDPWNILGFQGNFPLFNHAPDSTHDSRVEQLLDLVEHQFGLYAHVLAEAAAVGDAKVEEAVQQELSKTAEWWDKFATYEVSGVRRVCGGELAKSARFVAKVLAAWRQSGASAGDVGFWRSHAEGFSSAQTFALVVEALLQRGDDVAALALLMHWLGQADSIPLEGERHSFSRLSLRWMANVLIKAKAGGEAGRERMSLVRRFFDLLEVNADELWQVPGGELFGDEPEEAPGELEPESSGDVDADGDSDAEGLFGAAYEGVVFRDSAADGVEGEMLESGGGTPATDDGFAAVAERLEKHIVFVALVARLWEWASLAPWRCAAGDDDDRCAPVGWLQQSFENRRRLMKLIARLHQFEVSPPSAAKEAIAEFGRLQAIKEEMLHRTIVGLQETGHSVVMLAAACTRPSLGDLPEWERELVRVRAAVRVGDRERVKERLPALFGRLRPLQILYVPLHAGGDPKLVAQARYVRDALRKLALDLPSLGLFRETYHLLHAAQQMERNQLSDSRQVTEFDSLFTVGYRAAIENLVATIDSWQGEVADDEHAALLVGEFVDRFSRLWKSHLVGVRLSEVERRSHHREWEGTVRFVKAYGRELFTQGFLQLVNIRGVLRQGVGAFLDCLLEAGEDASEAPAKLIADLEKGVLSKVEAIDQLEFILQVVSSHYDAYKDYNLTTTQSDYGENLHVLFELIRVSVAYERSRWGLRPAYVAHRILTAQGRPDAAVILHRALVEETATLADSHLKSLAEVEKKHGVRLASISDRLAERFVRPLHLDRVLALVEPSMKQADQGDESVAFAALRRELTEFTETPTGAGLETPGWLRQLETEVERVRAVRPEEEEGFEAKLRVSAPRLSFSDLMEQLNLWDQPLTGPDPGEEPPLAPTPD